MPQGSGGGFDWRTLLQAVSTVAPYLAQQRVQSQQFGDLQTGREQASEHQRAIDERLGNEIETLERSGPEAEQRKALADYTTALQQARRRGTVSAPATSQASERFQADAGDVGRGVAEYGRRQAGFASRLDAPQRQRLQEQQGLARAGEFVNTQARHAGADQFLAELRARQRRVNPWVGLLSQIGSRIAANYEGEDEDDDGLAPIRVQPRR